MRIFLCIMPYVYFQGRDNTHQFCPQEHKEKFSQMASLIKMNQNHAKNNNFSVSIRPPTEKHSKKKTLPGNESVPPGLQPLIHVENCFVPDVLPLLPEVLLLELFPEVGVQREAKALSPVGGRNRDCHILGCDRECVRAPFP